MVGESLKEMAPSSVHKQNRAEGVRQYFDHLPTLEQARAEWDTYTGHPENWDDADNLTTPQEKP